MPFRDFLQLNNQYAIDSSCVGCGTPRMEHDLVFQSEEAELYACSNCGTFQWQEFSALTGDDEEEEEE